MKKYSTPILELVILEANEDIITTSGIKEMILDDKNSYSGFGSSNATQGVWNW